MQYGAIIIHSLLCTESLQELDAFFERDSGLKALDVEAARVIKACTNTNIPIDEEERVINVCKAVQEMNDLARQEGLQKGIQKGRLEGRQEVRLETLCSDIQNVMESFHVSLEEAMTGLKVPKEDWAILRKRI